MARSKPQLPLEESWVVEDEYGSPEKSQQHLQHERDPDLEESSSPSPSPTRKTSRKNLPRKTKSPEPEFFMPSLDNDTLSASMSESPKKRAPRSPQREKGQEARRRKPYQDTIPPPKHSSRRHPTTQESALDIFEVILSHGGTMLSHVLDVMGRALHIIKTPIAYLLAVWLLFGLLVIARNFFTTSLLRAVSPVCRLPLVSLLPIPFCEGIVRNGGAASPAEFDQLMNVQMKFEDVMKETAVGASLPGDMKRGETSIRDLRTLVRASHIHSKQELLLEFDGFVDTSQIASYDLQKFNSHVGRAVDTVLATSRWTGRVLEDIRLADASRGSISGFFNDKVFAVFQPTGVMTESKLLMQYVEHAQIIEDEISKLVAEAQALLSVLDNLEDRLELIHSLVIRDGAHASAKRQEILSELWTMLGGNKQRLSKVGSEIELLTQVGVYRQKALAHVTGTMIRLQEIGAGIEDLRERVATPRVLSNKNIPLSVHIENILLGVERLEEGRNQAKELEDKRVRRVLDGGNVDAGLIDAR